MAGFEPFAWTADALEQANDMTAAAGDDVVSSLIGNEINSLICEVQAWRRTYPEYEFASGPNALMRRSGKAFDSQRNDLPKSTP